MKVALFVLVVIIAVVAVMHALLDAAHMAASTANVSQYYSNTERALKALDEGTSNHKENQNGTDIR